MLTQICRFGPIVQGLLMKSNEQLRTESLILINVIITQPDDLDFRMHLRNEFMRVGLLDVLDVSTIHTRKVQESQKRFVHGSEKFVPALAYLFRLALPGSCLARFTNLFWEPCRRFWNFWRTWVWLTMIYSVPPSAYRAFFPLSRKVWKMTLWKVPVACMGSR